MKFKHYIKEAKGKNIWSALFMGIKYRLVLDVRKNRRTKEGGYRYMLTLEGDIKNNSFESDDVFPTYEDAEKAGWEEGNEIANDSKLTQ